jgi:hypothetical protein
VATVKDTETFIVAARAIHGSRYDYSKTVFTRSDSPVTIGCRVCGPFVLKQAESHYRGKKQCGCKTCNKKASLRKSGRFHVCRKCRKWAIYKDAQGYCRDCKGLADKPKADEWAQWAKAYGNSFFRDRRRIAAKHSSPWSFWAARKQTGLCIRKRIGRGGAVGTQEIANWSEFARIAIHKMNQRRKYREMSKWEARCCSWASTLNIRKRLQPGTN